MVIAPYKRPPSPPRVAILTQDGEAVDEDGALLDLDNWPPDTRIWAAYETIWSLLREQGLGEALCWRGEEIRWRHRPFEEEWRPRPSDVSVLRVQLGELSVERQLAGLRLWRDWLASYGASPTGTSGSAAWSLLRSRLERMLFTGTGERPPVRFTVGGRQELGPAGRGRFEGELVHLDIPAAYASTLAGLRYGGVWVEHDPAVAARNYVNFAGGDHPVFLRAILRLGGQAPGPVVRRPRKRPHNLVLSMLTSSEYPASGRIQGVWTFEELAAAERHGARIVKVLNAWTHRSSWHPFAPWWLAIEEGRALGGLPGQLAKLTGNALWGRFCMDSAGGVRTIKRARKDGRLVSRTLPSRPQQYAAHDLAETVSGRVRARLYRGMVAAGDGLVTAHTDGLWTSEVFDDDSWRRKEAARVLDVLDPQSLRWWPVGRFEPMYSVAGVPLQFADPFFEKRWLEAGLVPEAIVP